MVRAMLDILTFWPTRRSIMGARGVGRPRGLRPVAATVDYGGGASEFSIEEDRIYHRASPRFLDSFTGKWRPSIHMPRWASRINLLVNDVRLERVQEITEENAGAEGVFKDDDPHWLPSYEDPDSGENPSYKNSFEFLWDSIYGKKPGLAWNNNPWVWVADFEVMK